MILELLKFLPLDNSALSEGANQLKNLSDEEFLEMAYILRKIIRECYYNTASGDILFRGMSLAYDDNCEVFVMLSKLISKSPFQNKYVAQQNRKVVLSKEGGVK